MNNSTRFWLESRGSLSHPSKLALRGVSAGFSMRASSLAFAFIRGSSGCLSICASGVVACCCCLDNRLRDTAALPVWFAFRVAVGRRIDAYDKSLLVYICLWDFLLRVSFGSSVLAVARVAFGAFLGGRVCRYM